MTLATYKFIFFWEWVHRLIARVIGVGIETADMLVHEVLSRDLRDRRAVARYAGLTGSPEESGAVERFKREAQMISLINHPNVVAVYDIVNDDDGLYFTMEYVAGMTYPQARKRYFDPAAKEEAPAAAAPETYADTEETAVKAARDFAKFSGKPFNDAEVRAAFRASKDQPLSVLADKLRLRKKAADAARQQQGKPWKHRRK